MLIKKVSVYSDASKRILKKFDFPRGFELTGSYFVVQMMLNEYNFVHENHLSIYSLNGYITKIYIKWRLRSLGAFLSTLNFPNSAYSY